jgi:hypothetical protein
VIVNGRLVKRDGRATDALPGVPVRYPVEEEGRFVRATTKQWLETFTIDDGSLGSRARYRLPDATGCAMGRALLIFHSCRPNQIPPILEL